jgi:hypothetical protein
LPKTGYLVLASAGVSRNTWINLVSMAALLVVAGLIVAVRPVHASYPYESASGARTTAVASCITPWNDFVGNVQAAPSTDRLTAVQTQNIEAGATSCWDAIAGRSHVVWTLILLALVPLAILAVLALRRPSTQETRPTQSSPLR